MPAYYRTGIRDIVRRKGSAPIVCLTAYSAPVAKILDAHTDLLLVGDSLGMVVYGLENTQGVTVRRRRLPANHTRAAPPGDCSIYIYA